MAKSTTKEQPVTITKNGQTATVEAKEFRAKPLAFTRVLAADAIYESIAQTQGQETADEIEATDALEQLIQTAGEFDPQVQSFVTHVLEDRESEEPKHFQSKKFCVDFRRLQPTRSRAGEYSGKTKGQLKARIVELETKVEELRGVIESLKKSK